MEKRFWLGIILLVILLLCAAFSSVFLYNSHMKTSQLLAQDTSQEAIAKAHNMWKTSWKLTAIFTDHAPGEEIQSLFDQLEGLTDPSQIQGICRLLSAQLRSVAESQLPVWWTIL